MRTIERNIEKFIHNDLHKKMVFVGGPRQCGKTTLAKNIINNFKYRKNRSGLYLNWDSDDDRRTIRDKNWDDSDQLLVFDELHKYLRWKNWLKGYYDKYKDLHNILVTGSARLDIYRRGGDSMLGRYHYWRLHPFDLTEKPRKMSQKEAYKRLITVGGFPDPFLDGDEREARRWRRERLDRVIKDDIRDLENIKDIQMLKIFLDELRKRVGSSVVLSNIARDLEISPTTAKKWLESLEKMYLCFSIRPRTKNVPRSILKPPKVYFFDNADLLVDSEGAAFENLVATFLLKRVNFIEDYEGYNCSLNYIRDKEGREVDFAFAVDDVLEELIEVKLSDEKISSSLLYFVNKLQPKRAVQIVANLKKSYTKDNIEVLSIYDYCNSRKIG
ncbi:MAG: ATP-binding protein [Bacteriovoracia bacterium]